MVDMATKEQLIDLRAQGLSYEKIAAQLNISKPTVLQLAHEYEQEIARMKHIRLEMLAEKYKLLKQARIEALAKVLEKVNSALDNADLDKVSPDKLLFMQFKLIDRIQSEMIVPCDIHTVMCAPTDTDKATGHYILKVD